jgi:hypothetical protein
MHPDNLFVVLCRVPVIGDTILNLLLTYYASVTAGWVYIIGQLIREMQLNYR